MTPIPTAPPAQDDIAACCQAVAELPESAAAHLELGLALARQGNAEMAAKAFVQALALQPGSAVIHADYGAVLVRLGRIEEGILHFRKALAADPQFSGAATNLGVALNMLGRATESLAALKTALAQTPDDALAETASGDALEMLGDFSAAREAYARALALQPRSPSAYRRLFVHMKTVPPDDPRGAALQELAKAEGGFSDKGKAELHIAQYCVCRSAGRNAEAFAHLLAGNAAMRRTIVYDEAKTLASFDDMADVFPAALLTARSGAGDPSDVPVFVVGMPRSGTTLVEQILASHPDVCGAGEVKCLEDLISRDGGRILAFDPQKISDGDLKRLGGRYVRALQAHVPPGTQAKRIVDKMPWNFRLIGAIRLMLPNARILHVMRDPQDTCLSSFSLLFRQGNEYAYDLSELGRYYRAYRQLMAHWRAVLPEGAMLEVQYEDLVTDFEPQARRLIAWCGLDWDERCRAFYETERVVLTSSAEQVRRPLYTSSIGRWKAYAEALAPLRAALGE